MDTGLGGKTDMLSRWWNTSLEMLRRSRFARIILLVWGTISLWDTFGSQLVPTSVREKWPTVYDLAAKSYLPWWGWLLIGAAIMTILALEYAAHHKRRAQASDTLSGRNTFPSSTITQKPPTSEQVRAAKSAPLRKMRKAGVALRNEPVINEGEFANWIGRYEAWKEKTLKAAAKLSPVLHDRLEVVNEVRGIPGNVKLFSGEHKRRVGKMSEMLRRIDKYLEDHEQ